MAPKIRPVKERFEEKIYYGLDGCWYWIASLNKAGYGKFGITRGTHIGAHRASWQLYKGEIPDGLFVLHHCDNPACVNPDHLFLGTDLDNMRDKSKKGRCPDYRGSNAPRATLTDNQVIDIRRLNGEGKSIKEIANLYVRDYMVIYYIVRRKTFTNI